jgi:hypothetical protein
MLSKGRKIMADEPNKLLQIRDLLAAYRDLERVALSKGTKEKIRHILDAYAESV